MQYQQIKSLTLDKLIERHKRDDTILKRYYSQERKLGNVDDDQILRIFATRKGILHILEEVKKQKTTSINVTQLSLFK